MAAFLASLVLTAICIGIVVQVRKRRAPGTPLTWGEAFVAAVFVFAVMLLVYGIVPNQWLLWADGDLKWRRDQFGIPGIPGGGGKRLFEDGLSFGGRGRVMIPLEVSRDIIATVIYVVALVGNVYAWSWWQNYGKKKPGDDQTTSAYGRPLVKGGAG